MLIIDELHQALSHTLIKIFDKVHYKYFVGLTGTLNRLDGREEILSQFTKVVDRITMQEAIQNKWLSPYRYYKVLVDVDLTEYNELNQKFNTLFAIFDFDFNLAMKLSTDYKERVKFANKMGYTVKQITGFAMA